MLVLSQFRDDAYDATTLPPSPPATVTAPTPTPMLPSWCLSEDHSPPAASPIRAPTVDNNNHDANDHNHGGVDSDYDVVSEDLPTEPTSSVSSSPSPQCPPPPRHPMITRAKAGIFKPKYRADLASHGLLAALHASTDPTSFKTAARYPHWRLGGPTRKKEEAITYTDTPVVSVLRIATSGYLTASTSYIDNQNKYVHECRPDATVFTLLLIRFCVRLHLSPFLCSSVLLALRFKKNNQFDTVVHKDSQILLIMFWNINSCARSTCQSEYKMISISSVVVVKVNNSDCNVKWSAIRVLTENSAPKRAYCVRLCYFIGAMFLTVVDALSMVFYAMSIKVLSTAVVGAVEESKGFITFSLTSGLKYLVSQASFLNCRFYRQDY
ncbi:unnamed protein product [Lactuca virosa]|uniref:CASP-like protein n=1 Tax=Lactuca virosa TaxID=75947 RepID=A0AAU9P8H5_9ASTR|nr:unnamed protein product [Lactuca virosa]